VRGERVAARCIDDERRVDRERAAALRDALDARRAPVPPHDARDGCLFSNVRAARARVTKEHLVEVVARDLERVIELRAPCSVEAKAAFLVEVVVVEARAVLPDERARDAVEDADLVQHQQRVRKERLAQVKAREPLFLEHDGAHTRPCEACGADRPARSPSDERDIEALRHRTVPCAQSAVFGGGPSWMRSPMYAPISVNMTPIALMTT